MTDKKNKDKNMKNVLICSIARDVAPVIDYTLSVIKRQAEKLADDYNISMSIFENDSVDNTVDLINGFDWEGVLDFTFTSETLGTQKFDSVVDKSRIDGIAFCRNACMKAVDLSKFDIVVWLDADYVQTEDCIKKLIEAVDSDKDGTADIASAYSLHADINRPEMELFDKWATRAKPEHIWWHCVPHKLLPDVVDVYATFNGLCAYKAQPFKDGLKFVSGSKHNEVDVEHISICEGFADAGFGKIVMLKDVIVLHLHDQNNLIPYLENNTPGGAAGLIKAREGN